MRRAAAALTITALAAASGVRAADTPAPGKCVMYLAGDLKVRVTRNRAMLDGAINGQPVRVLLDTGASSSILFRAKARALGLTLEDVRGARMGGAGGVTQVQSVYLDKLQLAGASVTGIRMLAAGEGATSDFDVLLGEDVLGHFDVEFDLKHDAVRLLQPRNCAEGDMAYWATQYNETPIIEDRRDKINVTVS